MLALIAKNIGNGNGASLSALDVLIALGQIDSDIKLIHTYKNNLPHELDGKKVQYSQSFISPRNINSHQGFTFKGLANKIVEPFLLNRLAKINPDMTLINSMGSHSLWMPIKKKFHWPGTLIIRESPNLYKDLDIILHRFKYYDYFIFVSEIVRNKWLEYNVIDKEKSFYIPNCIWEEKTSKVAKLSKTDVKKKLFGNNDNFISICSGEIKYRKGQDLIVKNLKAICNLIPNFKLILLGRKNQAFFKKLNKILLNSGLKEKVEYIHHQPNAIEYIYAADVLLQPSRSEALPRTILEAMALKTPIIASDVDGIPELVEDGMSAILFSLSNLDKMIQGTQKIFLDTKYKQKLTENASQRYWKYFSREHHIQKYASFLKQIQIANA